MRFTSLFCVILNFICLAVIYFPKTAGQKCPSDKDKDWSWDMDAPNGPPHWGKKYPDCDGKKQSPINIKKKSVQKGQSSDGLKLTNYNKGIKKATIKNTGHLVIITPTDGVERSVELDGTTYNLREFHFHWGHRTEKSGYDLNTPGSEHKVDNRQYTMEIHLAHYDKNDKLVVVAGFLWESYNPSPTTDKILEKRDKYQYAGDEVEVSYKQNDTGIRLDYLVDKGCPYYMYEGSNTFPPCKQDVTWMICKQPAIVDTADVFAFEELYTVKKGDPNVNKCNMVDIIRPIQPLNDRTVYSG